MKNHIVSLDIAKQLKEAGWKKETEFWWVYAKYWENMPEEKEWDISYGHRNINIDFPAPLATEILEELPVKYWNNKIGYDERLKEFHCWNKWGKNLADACAEMWLYLKKNNLLTSKEK